jgi:TP901 family phage tail tape measure protein
MASRFSISAIFRGIDRMTKPAREISKTIARVAKSAENAVGGLNSQLGAVDAKLRSVGKSIAVAGAVGAAGLVSLGKAGADFEEAISAVGAASLKTRDQIKDLEKEALRLGSTTKFTATEAANAMEVMARAGMNNEQIIASTPGLLAAAAAENITIAEVADVVTSALSAFNMEAQEASKVADILAVASTKTKSSIKSLGVSLQSLAPVAHEFGINMKEATAMAALMQDIGVDESESGNAVRTMLSNLATPSKAAEAVMKELGVSFKDAKGNMLPPVQLFQQLQKAANGLDGNMDRVAFFTELVGARGQKAALALQRIFNSDKAKDLLEALDNASGSAEKMAKLRMDNLKGDLTMLSSATEGLHVALFQTESGPLRNIVKGMTEWIGANQALIVSGFTAFMAGLRDNLPTIVTWLERIGKMVAVFYGFRLGVMALTGALKVLNFVAMLNPWTALVYGLVAAVALIWAFWPEISAFFGRVGKSISEFASSAGKWFSGVWDSVLSFGRGVIAAVSGFFAGIWDAIKGPLLAVGEFLLGLLTLYIQPAVWLFKGIAFAAGKAAAKIVELWRPVGEFLGRLWDDIVYAATDAVAAISNVVSQIGGWIAEAWATVADVAASVWTSITEAATRAYNAIKSAFEPIRSFFSELWNGVASAFRSALGGVLEKVTWMIDNAGKLVDLVRSVGRDAAEGDITVGDGKGPSTTNPNAATVRELRENKTSAEVTIKSDKPAAVTKKPNAPGLGLRLSPSGAV